MSSPAMSPTRLILASLRYHRRMNLAVGIGVLAGVAVLTGALLVGDSVRGSLTALTLDRLGSIDQAIVADHFFRRQLADEVAAGAGFADNFSAAVPVMLLQGSASQPDWKARANHVTLLGIDESYLKLGSGGPARPPKDGEAVINQTLADELAGPDRPLNVGDDVILRLPRPADIPADSPLGRKTETVANLRVRVVEIIPAHGLGAFSLHPSQQSSRNAYLTLADLQQAMDLQADQINGLLVAGRDAAVGAPQRAVEQLQTSLRPRLADYGLTLARSKLGYFNLTSQQMMLEPAVEAAARDAFRDILAQPVLTYLANYIAAGPENGAKIPYSTVAGLETDLAAPLGPLVALDGRPVANLGADEIALSAWAADDLARQGVSVQPGDEIRLTYFEPESTHGEVRETTHQFKLKSVVKLEGSAADPDLTPELKGVTDQESLADWNPPFPYDPARVRDVDEKYWDDHRATPKAFVSPATAERLWGSRFGRLTSLRIAPAEATDAESLEAKLLESLSEAPASFGFAFRPVKQQGLAASSGTTPFNWLFIGFSFFIIAAAVMLVALLFGLGLDRRSREVGVMLAVGLTPRQVRRWLLVEGLLVAACGGLLGVAAGVGYAWLMIAALTSPRWWLSAVSTPFLKLHVMVDGRPSISLAIGYISGVLVSLGAIAWSVRRMRKASVRSLLAGQSAGTSANASRPGQKSLWLAIGALVLALVSGLAARTLSGEAQAGAFFGSGALVLTATLALLWRKFRAGTSGSLIVPGSTALARLAVRNSARFPGRSTLSMGLIASASFLIVAISAFRLSPPAAIHDRASSSGGFSLLAESDLPIHQDLNRPEGQLDLGFSSEDGEQIAGCPVFSLRLRPGDDASCLNLYQPQQPRVLGVGQAMIERGGFAWAGSAATSPEERENPWLLLERTAELSAGEQAPVAPVVLDANTAMYSLHLSGVGARYAIKDGRGRPLTLEVVGLLKNSFFQGDLLLSERDFRRHFPDTSGYRVFLIDAPADRLESVESTLENALGDYGFDVERAQRRLADLMAVQNTYLSTFQSLGGLGLLLGTLGLAVVQMRNVLERRGELALLRAVGFPRRRLGRLVMLENAWLLIGGLAAGLGAALVAVLPHLLAGGASIPWLDLSITLGLVLGVGLAAGALAVRAALKAPLLPALRGD